MKILKLEDIDFAMNPTDNGLEIVGKYENLSCSHFLTRTEMQVYPFDYINIHKRLILDKLNEELDKESNHE